MEENSGSGTQFAVQNCVPDPEFDPVSGGTDFLHMPFWDLILDDNLDGVSNMAIDADSQKSRASTEPLNTAHDPRNTR